MMKNFPLCAALRFRCRRDLKPRLKKIARAKGFRKYQAMCRKVLERFVAREEKRRSRAKKRR